MLATAILILAVMALMVLALMVKISSGPKMPKSVMVPGKGLIPFHPDGFIETDDEELIEFFNGREGYLIDGIDSTQSTLGDVNESDSDDDDEIEDSAESTEDPATWEMDVMRAYAKKHGIKPSSQKKVDFIKVIREHLGIS